MKGHHVKLMKREKVKGNIPFKIVVFLEKKDKPMMAAHIAKGLRISPQLVDYHIKKMVEKGILIVEQECDTKFYRLQAPFYMEIAETGLMSVLTPWVKEFAKEIEITEDMDGTKQQIVFENLNYYVKLFLSESLKGLF